jgi:hypothetical protein
MIDYGQILYNSLREQEGAEFPDDWEDLTPYWQEVFRKAAHSVVDKYRCGVE